MKNKIMLAPENEHVWAGVCGGLARHFDIDPVYVRLAFFALVLCSGVGFFLYLFLSVAMPEYKDDGDQ